MCSSQKSISSSENIQISTKSLPEGRNSCLAPQMEKNQNLSEGKIQTPDDRAEVIRSNKNILRRNLRNSLLIPKSASVINSKQENLTAASLKDLESDQYLAFKKGTLENTESIQGSSKQLITVTEKILQEAFDQKYELLKKIGQGAHSTVYKAISKVDNKLYALKKIKNVSFENRKKLISLFRMIKHLNHENVVKYTDFFFDQQKRTAYVVMEYCEFNDLRSEISKRSMVGKEFSQAEILSIFRQVASVLKYLHSEGICHRDLKPENILYSKQSGQIKVIDLDVCGVKKSKTGKFDLWTNTGTLLYRAPQTFELGYNEKADIWSLGTVIFELINGQVPFQTEYEKDFLLKLKNEQVNFSLIRTGSKLAYLLKRCLEKDSSKRISGDDLLDLLESRTKDDLSLPLLRSEFCYSPRHFEECGKDKVCLGNILQFTTTY